MFTFLRPSPFIAVITNYSSFTCFSDLYTTWQFVQKLRHILPVSLKKYTVKWANNWMTLNISLFHDLFNFKQVTVFLFFTFLTTILLLYPLISSEEPDPCEVTFACASAECFLGFCVTLKRLITGLPSLWGKWHFCKWRARRWGVESEEVRNPRPCLPQKRERCQYKQKMSPSVLSENLGLVWKWQNQVFQSACRSGIEKVRRTKAVITGIKK